MAARTISAAGGNYNAVGTWDEGVVPTSLDTIGVRAGGDSGSLTVTAAAAAASVDLTAGAYNGTLTINSGQTWTVSGASGLFKLPSSGTFSLAGTGKLTCTGTGMTLPSQGTTIPWDITHTGSVTHTLADDWTVTGLVTLGTGTNAYVSNGQSYYCQGGFTAGVSSGSVTGTTTIRLTATGTLTGPSGTGTLQNNLVFAAGGGTITQAACRYQTGTITYTSGTMNCTGTLTLTAATTLDTSGMTWGNVTSSASSTITLSSQLNWSGTLTHSLGATVYSGAFNLNGANWTINGATAGTNTTGGTVTLSGALTLGNTTSTTFGVGTGTITAATCTISGSQTVTPASNQTITISGLTTISDACVITASGSSVWNTGGLTTTGALTGTQKITVTGGTITLTAACSNSMDLAGNITLAAATNLYAASGTPTLTYVSGTITTTGSTLSIASSCTLDLDGITINNLTITAAATVTINGKVTGAGTLTTPDAAVTFAGTAGWEFENVTNVAITATRITTFGNGRTYTINNDVTTVMGSAETVATRHTWTSDHASIRAILTLAEDTTQDLMWVDPTRMDSAAGPMVLTTRGTITDSLNWTADVNVFQDDVALNPLNGMLVAR